MTSREDRATTESEGREAAEKFRDEHHLGTQPIADLATIIEQATGVDAAVLDVGADEHGLTMRDPERGTVFIAAAKTVHPMRQRSSLAHELGHVLFEDWAEITGEGWGERAHSEIRADAFARHLLMPLAGLRNFVGDRAEFDHSTLSAVVQRFIVSPAIVAIAMRQADYVTDAIKEGWMALDTPALAARFGWSDWYRALQAGSDRRRAPQRLLTRAIQGYLENVVSLQTLATLRGVGPATVEAELREAGLVPDRLKVEWADPAGLPDVDIDLTGLDHVSQDPPG
jgi:Zn-dependent peptidase ImmA (M78 family)